MVHNKKFRKIWKKIWRSVFGFCLVQWVIAIFLYIPICTVYLTSRKQVIGLDVLKKYSKKPAVFVCWHGRSMMLGPIVRRHGIRAYVVASRHKDGRMMAKLQRLFGLRAILGSSSEGGVSVLRQGVRVLREGRYSICLSPDGPSGPSMRLHDGALYFAKMTGAPIIPVCYSSSRAWVQNRWDRYLVTLHFSRIKCIIGKPIFIDKNITGEEFEEKRRKIEDIMVKQVRDLDAEFNLPVVEQGLTASEFKQKIREERANKKKRK